MASSVTEGQIKKLRKVGYLFDDIAHRLPDEGQLIPTPGSMRGWCSSPISSADWASHSTHLSRGLMFYYGLDFHDLAPNFILNISAFIIVCEAFLRIQPHFGLWLKIFSIKPKVVGGRQAECGGAMVGKMPNILWLEGSFVDHKGVAIGVVLYHRPA